MIKYTYLLFISVLTISFSTAQGQNNIEGAFMAYQKLLQESQFEASMQYVHPKLFEVFPKKKMLQVLKTMANNPMINSEIMEAEVLETSEVKEVEGSYYATLKYRTRIKMQLVTKGMQPNKKRILLNQMEKAFIEQFGEENVRFDKENDSFILSPVKDAVAISENGASDWKFIPVEKNQKLMMEKILPKEIAAALF